MFITMCFVSDEKKRTTEVSMSLRGRKKEEFRDTWHARDSAWCTFNGRDTNTSSTQRHLYLAMGGFASLMRFTMGGVF